MTFDVVWFTEVDGRCQFLELMLAHSKFESETSRSEDRVQDPTSHHVETNAICHKPTYEVLQVPLCPVEHDTHYGYGDITANHYYDHQSGSGFGLL